MRKRAVLVSISLGAAALVYADMPPLAVTIVDASGKVAYTGKTTVDGTFTTGTLRGGEYVVMMKSDGLPTGNYAAMVSSGRHKVLADALPNGKFSRGGI